jgi:hypothetical protein
VTWRASELYRHIERERANTSQQQLHGGEAGECWGGVTLVKRVGGGGMRVGLDMGISPPPLSQGVTPPPQEKIASASCPSGGQGWPGQEVPGVGEQKQTAA